MIVMFLREQCAATPGAQALSACAFQGMRVMAGCVGVSSLSFLYQVCVSRLLLSGNYAQPLVLGFVIL